MAPDEFLRVADELLKVVDGREVHRRCAVSRAYYGLFHMAMSLARSEFGYRPKEGDGGSHQSLIDFFIDSDVSGLPEIGRGLQSVKRKRHKADYKIEKFVSQVDARATLIQVNLLVVQVVKYQDRRASA